MKFKVFSTAIAALSLGVAPTLAAAQPVATPLTQSGLTQPASEQVDGDSALRGRGDDDRRHGGGFLVFGIAVIIIGLGVYIAVHNRHKDRPNSP